MTEFHSLLDSFAKSVNPPIHYLTPMSSPMLDTTETTKRIILSTSTDNTSSSAQKINNPSHKHPNLKIPRKKIGSQTDHWISTSQQYSTQESQNQLLRELSALLSCLFTKNTGRSSSGELLSNPSLFDKNNAANILLSHLKTKQSGYRSQDTLKEFYDPERFVQIPDIVALLIESNLSCFYCQKWATLFYENVRDPRQWSLERISNAEGHNRDNVVIACLECNMRRRTMYYERYIATKQLRVNKLEHSQI